MNRFVIEAKLPSLNEVINENRRNRYAGASLKRKTEALISGSIKKALREKTVSPEDKPIELIVEWHEKSRRRDADNIQSSVKFVLDSMKYCGLIKDDSRKFVRQIRSTIIDDSCDYVVVEMKGV